MKHFPGYYITILQANPWYNLLITVLATISILGLGAEIFLIDDPTTILTLQRIDLVIAWIFLSDFFLGLLFNQAKTRSEYWRTNWLNLVSSIPISSEITRTLRVLRILRATRLLRVSANFWFAQTRLHTSTKNITRVQ